MTGIRKSRCVRFIFRLKLHRETFLIASASIDESLPICFRLPPRNFWAVQKSNSRLCLVEVAKFPLQQLIANCKPSQMRQIYLQTPPSPQALLQFDRLDLQIGNVAARLGFPPRVLICRRVWLFLVFPECVSLELVWDGEHMLNAASKWTFPSGLFRLLDRLGFS